MIFFLQLFASIKASWVKEEKNGLQIFLGSFSKLNELNQLMFAMLQAWNKIYKSQVNLILYII